MESSIPFQGFYNSLLDFEIDGCIERETEYYVEESGAGSEVVSDLIWRHCNFSQVHQEIARDYAEAFFNWVAEEFDVTVKYTFDVMTSPKEYNFTTDRIFVKLPLEDLIKVFKRVGAAQFRKTAKERFTSCDGFRSFYSPNPNTWGNLRGWDYNQVGTVFQALVDKWEGDLDAAMYYRLCEGIYTATINAIDWNAFEQSIKEAQAETQAEMDEEDIKHFPLTTNPAEYVSEYVEKNHLT